MKTRFKNYDLRFMKLACHCERKRSNLVLGLPRILWILVMTLALFLNSALTVNAQTVDPSLWQTGANGLLTTSNSLNRTAGLGFVAHLPNTSSWPFLMLQGGVIDGGWGHLRVYNIDGDPIGIDLGQIKTPGSSSVTSIQNTDWAHSTMNFNSSQLTLTLSRLTTAALIQTTNNSLRLLAGNVSGATFQPSEWEPYPLIAVNRTPAPSYPKYVAFHTTNGYQVESLSTSRTLFEGIDQNWILVWYGNNSHFGDTKVPNLYSTDSYYPHATNYLKNDQAYLADAPLLITFQNNPASIIHSPEGGIDLNFSSEAGNLSVMPLFGRDHPQASVTEEWGNSKTLPSSGAYNVISKLNFWVPRTCNFPRSVAESYSYDPSTDTASITDNITFTNICSSTPTFAPIPPMLAIAKNTLRVTFSGTLVDSNTHTEFGPLQGIENTNTYTWNLSGLKKYTDNKRVITNSGTVSDDLVQELQAEIDKVTQSGHLAPWIFGDKLARSDGLGDVYWMNPADTIYHLSEIIPVLPDPQKTNLITYLRNERNNPNYNPETVYNLPLDQGTFRKEFAATTQSAINTVTSQRPDVFLDNVPLYNFLSLARYYQATGDTLTLELMNNAKAALNTDLSNLDWATFSKYQDPKIPHVWTGFAERKRKETVIEQNRIFAGEIGLINLAKTANDQNTENLARVLLARTAVTRLAMLQYPRYLYSIGMVNLPSSPKWQVTQLAGLGGGQIINYNWTQSMDDPRQVAILDQFELRLLDHVDDAYATAPYYTAFRDMIPELFRFLNDFAKPELDIYRNKIQTMDPRWYVSLSPSLIGWEHGLNHPIDAYQLFMAQALVAKDTPENLAKYLDIPWLQTGDLFYINKLAETIKAYQGWRWEDEDIGVGIPGDVNSDNQVDVLDVQACVNHILGIQDLGNRADVNSDGSVNVLDVQVIVNIILGV